MDVVTGGCGFIGSHLVNALESPRVIDKKQGTDVLHMESKILSDVDVLYHLAAMPGVRHSVDHPKEVAKENIEGTLNVLEAARKEDVKKVVFTSSSSVYGDAPLPTKETQRRVPKSPYAVSKLAGEYYCKVYCELYGMKIMVVRPFTVYGPGMREDLAITLFARKMLSGKRPIVFGDGAQKRDFTYVSDVVEGMKLVAKKGKAGEAYNLGAGEARSVLEMVALLNKIMGTEILPFFDKKRKGDVENTLADNSKMRALGWEPRTNFEQGLRRVVDWIRAEGSLSRST